MTPNSGRVEPGQSIEVQGEQVPHRNAPRIVFTSCGGEPVMRQAMKEVPLLATKSNDKFMIQSIVITPEKESQSVSDIVRSNFLRLPATCLVFLTLPAHLVQRPCL